MQTNLAVQPEPSIGLLMVVLVELNDLLYLSRTQAILASLQRRAYFLHSTE